MRFRFYNAGTPIMPMPQGLRPALVGTQLMTPRVIQCTTETRYEKEWEAGSMLAMGGQATRAAATGASRCGEETTGTVGDSKPSRSLAICVEGWSDATRG